MSIRRTGTGNALDDGVTQGVINLWVNPNVFAAGFVDLLGAPGDTSVSFGPMAR
jgi:hypothetical protein